MNGNDFLRFYHCVFLWIRNAQRQRKLFGRKKQVSFLGNLQVFVLVALMPQRWFCVAQYSSE